MLNKGLSKFLLALVLTITILSTSIAVFAAAPTVSLTTPGAVGFYMLNEDLTVRATVNNSPTSVKLYWDNDYRKTLSLISGTTYGVNWKPISTIFWEDRRIGVYTAYGWGMSAKLKVEATNGDGTGYSDHAGHVTIAQRSMYSGIDSTWFHTSDQTNSFIGVFTGWSAGYHGQTNTYNCLAYVVGNETSWQWPTEWPSLTTTEGKNYLQAYMSKGSYNGYNYSSRPGSLTYSNVRTTYQPWTTKVIYYNGNHFAKVIAYDSNGYPSKLYSKWGCAELIKSTNKDCFASGGYGSAYYYID
jgi:hypothetical protein